MSLNIRRRAFLGTPYDDCTGFQSRSTELVVFSPSVGEYVTIAWPTSYGRRIVATGIKAWLRNRGLHWSCFCSLTFGGSKSTRIVEAMCGNVYVFCNNLNRSLGCGFQINLTQIISSAIYESEYEHLPLTPNAPDMAILCSRFRSIETTEHGPYFRGYCGEHESDYEGIFQLAGTSTSGPESARIRARMDDDSRRFRASIVPPRRTSTAYTRVRGRPHSTINFSAVQLDNTEPSVREQNIIDRLHAGEGVSDVEMSCLFEKCTACGNYFVASLLRVHIRGCAPDL